MVRLGHGAAAGGAGGPGHAAGTAGSAVPVPRRPRPVSAYVKVSDGCDRRCAFCAIPLIKGDYEIVPAAQVLAAARGALAAGARELVLVGQDTSRWAQPGWGGLERLLAELKALTPAPHWLRLLYLQPDGIDEALLQALAAHAVPYVDVPLQHASGAVLRRMRRHGDGAAFLDLLARVRVALPAPPCAPPSSPASRARPRPIRRAAGLRARGRPGGGRRVRLRRPGGHARGAPAGPGAGGARLERAARLGEVIDEQAAAFWLDLEGRPVEVLVERGTRHADGLALGRIALQAPDVDGRALLHAGAVRRGQLVPAVAVGAVGYDVEVVAR